MNIANETQQVIINSPGFDDTGYYSQQQECTWWIKVYRNRNRNRNRNRKLGISKAPLKSHARAPAYSWALRRMNGAAQTVVQGKLRPDFQSVRGDRVGIQLEQVFKRFRI